MIKARIGNFCCLPFDKFTIHAKQKPSDARDSLNNETKHSIVSELMFKNLDHNYKFFGEIKECDFKISRTIKYRNSFLPMIIGKIKHSNFSVSGTDIEVEMRLNVFVMIFGLMWFGGLILTSLSIIAQLVNDGDLNVDFAIPLIMLLFGYFLFTGAFRYEAAKARKLLITIIEGEEI